MATRRTLRWLVVISFVVLNACSGGSRPAPVNPLIFPVVTVKYVAGEGASREYIELTVEDDGGLSTGLNSPPPPRCRHLPPERVSAFSAQVRSAAVRTALAENVIASASPSMPVRIRAVPDPAVIVSVGEAISAFEPRALPQAILELIAAIDSAFHEAACAVPFDAIGPRINR